MITKINSFDNRNNVSFKTNNSFSHVMLKGEAYKQASMLRNTCKEIFSKLRLKESLIDGAKSKLGNMKLSDKSVTFLLSETDSARLAMPRGDEGNLFTMQILRDKKPVNTVTVNEFNYLIESYSLNNETFLSEKKYNKELVDKTIKTVYEAVDYPLLQLRLYIKQNCGSLLQDTSQKTYTSEVSKSNDKKIEQESAPFIPPSTKWEDYSLSEIIKQNAATYKPRKGVKTYTVIPKQTVYQIEGVNIPKRLSQTTNKKEKIETNEAKLQEQPVVEQAKKRRGRPPKVKEVLTSKISEPKEAKLKEPVEASLTFSIGKINEDSLVKINEIKDLNREIKTFLATKSAPVAAKICQKYPNFVKNRRLGFDFKDISFILATNEKFQEEEILSVSSPDRKSFMNMTLSGKIIDTTKPWSKIILKAIKTKYKTQEQVDEMTKTAQYNDLLDKTYENLKDFKKFIDNQAWKVRKDKTILKNEAVILDESIQGKLKNILDNYKKSKEFQHSMSYFTLKKASQGFECFSKSKSSRFEFINPVGDGFNYAFDISSNKHGEFYKLGKFNDKNELIDLFIVNFDGRVLQSISKTRGFKQPFPVGKNALLVYHSSESFDSDNLNKLAKIIDVLDEKTSEYEKYLSEINSKKKTREIVPQVESDNSKKINIDIVKEFLEKTANEIQVSADRLREVTGFKSMLDSVAESLKTKFNEFLEQFKAKQ